MYGMSARKWREDLLSDLVDIRIPVQIPEISVSPRPMIVFEPSLTGKSDQHAQKTKLSGFLTQFLASLTLTDVEWGMSLLLL